MFNFSILEELASIFLLQINDSKVKFGISWFDFPIDKYKPLEEELENDTGDWKDGDFLHFLFKNLETYSVLDLLID